MPSVLTPDYPAGDWRPPSRDRAGVIGLIIAEASLLGIFVVAYLFYIGKSLNGPYPKDVLELPIFKTVCLLASSVTVGLAVRALRQGDRRLVGIWLGEELRAFCLSALIIGTLAHGVISLLTGLLYAVILPMLPRRHMLWGGWWRRSYGPG